MKREAEDYARLVSELEADLADLERVALVNERAVARQAAGAREELDLMAWAMSLHNLYGVMESYALRIAKFFENGLDPVSWCVFRSILPGVPELSCHLNTPC